jgi:hypothetical protein
MVSIKIYPFTRVVILNKNIYLFYIKTFLSHTIRLHNTYVCSIPTSIYLETGIGNSIKYIKIYKGFDSRGE